MRTPPHQDRTLTTTPPTTQAEADNRTAHHMRICADMADLAADLARLAAARAKQDLTKPDPEPEPEPQPEPAPEPEAAAPQAQPAPRIRPVAIRAPSAKPGDYATLFTRLAATALACIAAYQRLATATAINRPAANHPADPRREKLREGFDIITKNLPNRTHLLAATATLIDQKCAADQTATVPEILATICDDLEIPIDLAHLPDEFLCPITDEIRALDIHQLIERCATYPPNQKK